MKGSFGFKEVEITLLPKKEAKSRKKVFTKKLKREFKEEAGASTGRWHVHHIHPVEYDGSADAKENMAAIKPKLHKRVHIFMKLQTRGMKEGDTRKILIPYQKGPVWK